MDALHAAIADAIAHEIDWPRDPGADPSRWGIHLQDPPPWNVLRGPVHPRGPCSGVIAHRGRELAAWGEPDRADQTFSVAKTYLALLAGVAHDRGLIPDPDEPVAARVAGIGFESARNAPITWTMLLQQTSEWEGTCLGIPDTVDRWRTVAFAGTAATGRKGDPRPLQAPGTVWEYNDVRINQLSIALMHVFGEPLPEVFEREILRPLGGGAGFRWEPYDGARVTLRGHDGAARSVAPVPGGSHWGGGVTISARDQARVAGLLIDGRGTARRPLLSAEWLRRMRTPCPIAPVYGMLLWLNRGARPPVPSAGPDAMFMMGAGGHLVWIDAPRTLVVVTRWLDPAHTDRFAARIAAAVADSGPQDARTVGSGV